MTITKLQRTVVDALEDIKAQDIRVFNTTGLSDLFDRVVVASATSNRQTRSLANHLKEKAKEKGFPVVSTEGEESGEWVLVDLGDMVVHIMQPAIRAYYNLEELWGAKPVKVKLGGGSPSGRGGDLFPPHAGGRVEADAPPTVARTAAARKPAGKQASRQASRQASGKQAGAHEPDSGWTAARKAATKTPASKAPGVKTVAARKPAVSGSPAKKAASSGVGKTGRGGTPARPTLTALRRVRTGQP